MKWLKAIAWRMLLYCWFLGKALGFLFVTFVVATQTAINGLHELADILK